MLITGLYRQSRKSGKPLKLRNSSFRRNDRFWVVFAFLALVFNAAMTHAEILIGVAGPLTGPYSAFGTQMVAGAKAAVEDINAKGGIEGELLDVVTADDGCDSRQAEAAAQNLIANKVRVVIGHFCSYPSLAAAKLYEAANIPMIAPSASLPALTEAGLANVVRVAPRDDAQGAFAARRMQQDFPNGAIAVLNDGSASAVLLAASFSAGLNSKAALSLTLKPDDQSLEDAVTAIKSQAISAVYCACTATDAGKLAAALDGTVKIYGPDALLVPQFWERSGQAGEGTRVSFAIDPQAGPDAKAVMRSLTSADGATLASYAAVQLFSAAAEASGSSNGQAMSAHLRSGKTFTTVLGPLSFDSKGDLRQPNFIWYTWSSGTYAAELSAD